MERCGTKNAGAGTAEAEDSSYDSDYEDSTVTTINDDDNNDTDKNKILSHSDVSRTSSDTLAAEFAEYVTVKQHSNYTNTGPGKEKCKNLIKLMNFYCVLISSNVYIFQLFFYLYY